VKSICFPFSSDLNYVESELEVVGGITTQIVARAQEGIGRQLRSHLPIDTIEHFRLSSANG
jgi:hypothetical protein